MSDWDKENIIGYASVIAGGCALAGIGQALQGASGIGQAFQTIRGVLSAVSTISSGVSLMQSISSMSKGFGIGNQMSSAWQDDLLQEVNSHSHTGLGFYGGGDGGGDPKKTQNPNYTPKITFESTKCFREALGFEFSVSIGCISWGESVYSSFANLNFQSCLFNACSNVVDNLTYHFYSNLKTAVGISCIGSNLFSGEYSLSDIGFGIGFVGAPTAVGIGFGGIVSSTGFRGFGVGFSRKLSAPRLTYTGTNVISNPIVGGGAKLSYLGNNIERIQNIATKYDLEISVVGGRAKGTATAVSDWDYIITGGTSKSRSSALFQLPKNIRATKDGNPRPGSEILKGTLVNPELPHITFKPKY